MDEKHVDKSGLRGALTVMLIVGLILSAIGFRDMYEAWVELCFEGTEYERCTEGQGRIAFGIGLSVALVASVGLVATFVRDRRG